jgi:hypothetical protein
MIETVDHLLEQYERGKLTRRDLLGGIALLVTSPLQKSPVEASVFKARSINHVNIRVADVNRSEAFYRKVLGFPPRRVVTPGTAFALDFPRGGFISLCLSLRTVADSSRMPSQATSTTSTSVSRTLTNRVSCRN